MESIYSKKSLLVLVIIICISIVFTGCQNNNNLNSDNDKQSENVGNVNSQNENSEKSLNKESEIESFTFTYWNSNPASAYSPKMMTDTKIGKIINEETGVDVEFRHLVGDPDTKIGVMIASGEYPDVIAASGGRTPKFLDAEAFIPLNDLMDKYAPTLKELYQYNLKRMEDPDDGNYYYIPSYAPVGDNSPIVKTEELGGFLVQKEMMKEMGYPVIETLEEYFDLIAQYKNKNEDAIGYEILIDSWRNTIQWAIDASVGWTAGDGVVCFDAYTDEMILRPSRPETKEVLKILNDAYLRGLIRKESFVNKYDQYKEIMAQGNVLGGWDAEWEVAPAIQSLEQQEKREKTWLFLPLKLDKTTKLAPQLKNITSGEGCGISIKAKNPEKIMQFFEYLSTEKVQKLVHWGVEGEDYIIDEDGLFTRTKDQIEAFKDQAYGVGEVGLCVVGHYMWPSADGIWSDGNACWPMKQVNLVKKEFDEWNLELCEAYDVEYTAQLANLESLNRKYNPIWNKYFEGGSPEKIAENELYELFCVYSSLLVTAEEGEFESVWEEYILEMGKIDIESMLEAYQRVVDFRNENW